MRHPIIYSLLLGAALTLGAAPVFAQQDMQSNRPVQKAYEHASAPRTKAFKGDYEKFGGKSGMKKVVDVFMDNLMADPRTHSFFAHVDRRHIKKELASQFCVILDGPCTYTGGTMKQVHKGLDINRADFNALVEDLQKAMSKQGVPFHAQNDLLSKLAPMHKVIITKK